MQSPGKATAPTVPQLTVERTRTQTEIAKTSVSTSSTPVSMTTKVTTTLPPLLASACKDHAHNWKTLDPILKKSVSKRLIVSSSHRLLFCYVPYHAATNWMKVMYHLTHQERQSVYLSHDKIPASIASNKSNHHFLSEFPPSEQDQIVEKYRKFVVVRHPLSRLATVYQQKFASHNVIFTKAYGRYIVQHYRHGAPPDPAGDDVKFSEFLQYITNTRDKDGMNEHWQPLEHLCQPCALHYTTAVHMETMDGDAKAMFKELGLDKIITKSPIPDRWEMPSADYIKSLYSTVPPSLLAELVKQYRNDVVLFGYSARV